MLLVNKKLKKKTCLLNMEIQKQTKQQLEKKKVFCLTFFETNLIGLAQILPITFKIDNGVDWDINIYIFI